MAPPAAQSPQRAPEGLRVPQARIRALGRMIARRFRATEVILFGSYARGDQTTDSDIDLLVVFPQAPDKAAEAVRIRRAIGRINTGVDIVVASAGEVAEWENVSGSIFYYARREGRPIHGDQPGSRA